MNEAWTSLSKLEGRLDKLEVKVNEVNAPAMPVGRETPYLIQKTFSFAPFDFGEQSSPIVNNAQRPTDVTRLSWAVSRNEDINTPNTRARVAMRPTSQGLVLDASRRFIDNRQVDLFDFEWAFEMGSTNRRYTEGRGISGFNSRSALGSPDTHTQLLISEKNPIRLGTNEFLIFKVRPILYNMDPTRNYTGDERFFVSIVATANRTFSP